jgi:FKBP-type peptidyl-prolyl cis-trans isomerase FkpA
MLKNLLFVALFAFFCTGCLKSSDSECIFDECSLKAPDSEIQAVQSYLTSAGITATQHCSGMFYSIENSGSGKAPNACSQVQVHYVGKFPNGTIFDQGDFNTTLSSVIRGWSIGVPLIREGGRIHLYIPPALGYGSQTNGPIPGNSILVFDIDLNKVY